MYIADFFPTSYSSQTIYVESEVDCHKNRILLVLMNAQKTISVAHQGLTRKFEFFGP